MYYEEYDYGERIADTLRINTIVYYKFVNTYDTSVSYYRVDTSSGILYRYVYSGCYNPNHEIAVDSLKSLQGDNFIAPCISLTINCTDTSLQNLFGVTFRKKKFDQSNYITSYSRSYLYGIGSYINTFNVNAGGHSYGESSILKGCIINGITYGNLSITGSITINSNYPFEFYLSQNYPNPFNPQTKIKFAVPSNVKREASNVKLVIYDLLGREVATLVNEELKPGTYEADWDASNYSNGVYFYKIISGDFVEAKKMVLMK
ncbi:MAG TPA: T9SS type A sorting domain-containing protein [Ignavibacteria bacterium]|nr:T9SS type A sorting domain-containing protein [Ignavibacteria bacterium]